MLCLVFIDQVGNLKSSLLGAALLTRRDAHVTWLWLAAPAQPAHLFSRALAGGSVGVRTARRVGRGGGSGGGSGQDRSCPSAVTGSSGGYSTVTSSSPATRTGRTRPSNASTGGPAENSSPGMDPIAELLSHLSTGELLLTANFRHLDISFYFSIAGSVRRLWKEIESITITNWSNRFICNALY